MQHIILIVVILCTALSLYSGCGSLKLDTPLTSTENDWLIGGGSPERLHFQQTRLAPPFIPDWEYNAGAGFASNALLAKGDILFISTLHGELHLVNIETGRRIGRMNVSEPISGSPVLRDNRIYLPLAGGDETLIAYDLLAGKKSWSKNIGPVESSLLLHNDILYAVSRNGTVYAFNPDNGTVHWKQELGSNIYASPSAADERMYLGTSAGIVFALDYSDGSVVWKSDTLRTIMTAAVAGGNAVYVASRDSVLYSLDNEKGGVVWSYNAGSRIYSAPSAGPDYVVFGTAGGKVIALDSASGTKRWSYRAKSIVNSSPLIAGDFVYFVSLDKNIYVLNNHDGTLQWSYEISSRLKTTPLIRGERLIICAEDRRVYSFKREIK